MTEKLITQNEMMIIGKYFEDIKDFKNVSETCKEYEQLVDLYLQNPIRVRNEKEVKIFRNIETLVVEKSEDLKIILKKEYKPKKIRIQCPIDIRLKERLIKEIESNDIEIEEIRYRSDLIVDLNEDVMEIKECKIDRPLDIDLTYTKIREIPNMLFEERRPKEIDILDVTTMITVTTLTSIKLPMTCTRLGKWSFFECRCLKYVGMSPLIEVIDTECFYRCDKLMNIELPERLTRIGDRAFHSCSKLRDIRLPEKLKEIGDSCFSGCDIEYIKIPSNVTYLGQGIFNNTYSLKQVDFEANVQTIPERTFIGCKELQTITIPTYITKIEKDCFKCCEKLKGKEYIIQIINLRREKKLNWKLKKKK